MTTLDTDKVLQALKVVLASDVPTTKKGAEKLADYTVNALVPLRDWLDELSGLLEEVEQSARELKEDDADDRESHFETLGGDAADLCALLGSLNKSD